MAKQGERYNPKTKTGWKFENGRTVYYKKGKILNNRQQLLSLGKEIVAPLVSGAGAIRDKLRISPLSETGESVFEYKTRTGAYKKEQLPDVQPRTWSDPYGAKSTEPSSIKNIPSEKPGNENKTSDKTSFKNQVAGDKSDRMDGSTMNVTDLIKPKEQYKSDVFTIDPETGKAVGVLTRSQRRAFDKKNQAALEKAAKEQLKIRTYRNKGDSYKRYG